MEIFLDDLNVLHVINFDDILHTYNNDLLRFSENGKMEPLQF